ncbi:hypothetical protein ABK040_008926 [Willaertia magna]
MINILKMCIQYWYTDLISINANQSEITVNNPQEQGEELTEEEIKLKRKKEREEQEKNNDKLIGNVFHLFSMILYLENECFKNQKFIDCITLQKLNETVLENNYYKNLIENYLNWKNQEDYLFNYLNTLKLNNLITKNRQTRAIYLCNNISNIPLIEISKNNEENEKVLKPKIKKHLSFLFGNLNTFEDCYLLLNNVKLPCHQIILFCKSYYLKALFQTNMEESIKIVNDNDLNNNNPKKEIVIGENLENLVENNYLFKLQNILPLLFYCYSNDYYQVKRKYFTVPNLEEEENICLTLNETNVCECLAVANYFETKSFKTACEYYINNFINNETIIPLLNICDIHEAYYLREYCYIFCLQYFHYIYRSKQFHFDLDSNIKDQIILRARKAGKSVPKGIDISNRESKDLQDINEMIFESDEDKKSVNNINNSSTQNNSNNVGSSNDGKNEIVTNSVNNNSSFFSSFKRFFKKK